MIELTDQEVQLLTEILESTYLDLKGQVYKADNSDFKAQLHQREALLEGMIRKLGVPITTAH